MKDIDPRQRLLAFVRLHGNQRKAAAALGISQGFLGSLVSHPEKPISPKVLARLGLRRAIVKVKRTA